MHFRKLGYTGLDISCIGFGTWQLGGKRWKAQSDEASINLLNHALDAGINLYDVADVYGQYQDENGYLQSRSQELLGKAFHNKRDRVIYSVKVGQFDEYSHRHNYKANRIVAQVQQSLRRLKTNYLDICLIHAPSIQSIINGRAIAVLQTLQAIGMVKYVGYSFEDEPEHVEASLNQAIDVIMLQYNLIDSSCKENIEKARLHGVGILAGGPFKRGYLTGKYDTIDDLPMDEDYWSLNSKLNPDKVIQTLKTVNSLKSDYGSAKALRENNLSHILDQAGVNSAVIGHTSPEEINDNISILDNYITQLKKSKKNIIINEEI